MNGQLVSSNGSDDTTSAPLAVEVTSAARKLKTLEKQREMELYKRLDTLHERHSTGLNTTKTKIVPGTPNKKLTKIQNIRKNTRSGSQFRKIKPKKSMTNK